jgi:hypothetical protein
MQSEVRMGLGIGSVSVSTSHRAGMSSLWHDPDFLLPEKRLETPIVVRTFDDLPVPTEHHELPPGVEDPFSKMDAMYDIAAQQMERGIRGAQFLHGKNPDREASGTQARPASAQRVRKPEAIPEVLIEQQRERAQHRDIEKASRQPLQAPQATKAGSDDGGVGAGVISAMVPVGAAQAVTAAIQGPLPTLATQAVAAVNVAAAVTSTAQLTSVGLTEQSQSQSRPAASPTTQPVSSGTASGDGSSIVRRGLR